MPDLGCAGHHVVGRVQVIVLDMPVGVNVSVRVRVGLGLGLGLARPGAWTEAEQSRLGVEEVLNGLAYDASRNALFVTGKCWPKLFHIELPRESLA